MKSLRTSTSRKGRHNVVDFRALRFESLEARRVLAATYYIDSVAGSDANAGTSTDSAWASLAKVRSTLLAPGDTVLLKRGSTWSESLEVTRSGTAAEPIQVAAYGSGADPVVFRVYITGSNSEIRDLLVDHQKQTGDAVLVRGAKNVKLQDMEVRNGANDGVDISGADGMIIDGLHIHHFLAGSFKTQVDAHGIAVSDTNGITIRNTQIHHVSGDSFQADPDRDTTIVDNILIEDSHFWTSPLTANFNSWRKGQRPGENAIDTKVVTDGWNNVGRMKLTVRDVVAHGWNADSFIANKAVFNLKEQIEAVFEGVTVYDSEIAFRIRGGRGNANTTIENAVIYDVNKAIRAEDDLLNLNVYNSTFGASIGTQIQMVLTGTSNWDLRNNAFLGSKPIQATHASNRAVSTSDFVNTSLHDYHLSSTSKLVDVGIAISTVSEDRDGLARPQGNAYDVGAYERPSEGVGPIDPGTDARGTDATTPGTDAPSTDAPGTDEPATGEPGTGEPGTGTTTPGTTASDIVVKSFYADGGQFIDVTYEVAGGTTGAFDVTFYRSSDSQFSTSDALLATHRVSAASDLTQGIHSLRLPLGGAADQIALPGAGAVEVSSQYYLLAVADSRDVVVESDANINEDNVVSLQGVYHLTGGKIYVYGSELDDTVTVTTGSLSVHFNGSTISYSEPDTTPIQARLYGGNDTLEGGAGNDLLIGGSGSDVYLFDADKALGGDTLDEAGGGNDTLDFSPTQGKAITANLSSSGWQTVNVNLKLTLQSTSNFENVVGGAKSDKLTGNTRSNLLRGGNGNDVYVFDGDVALGQDIVDDSAGIADKLSFAITSKLGVQVDLGHTLIATAAGNVNLQLAVVNSIEGVVGGTMSDVLTGTTGDDILEGGGGNDILNGRAGADLLDGGEGADILLGSVGNDVIVGREGRDLIFGGSDIDELRGGADDDIVISGATTYYDEQTGAIQQTALQSILKEWQQKASYTTRVAHLTLGGGVNGSYRLNSSTVLKDSLADRLYGEGGFDWYLGGVATVIEDLALGELSQLI